MATALLSSLTSIPPSSSLPRISTPFSAPCFLSVPRRRCFFRRRIAAAAGGGDFLGDFGARDPFPAEIESNFCEKVIGNVNTEHRILIPNIAALSLSQRRCEPVSPSQPPMSTDDANKLLRKVVGWRLVEGDGGMKLQCLWKVRDRACGVELIDRINTATVAAGHYPELHLEEPNQVRAELWTASIGGLSLNDFTMAAKIDEIKTVDLLPKKRIWA